MPPSVSPQRHDGDVSPQRRDRRRRRSSAAPVRSESGDHEYIVDRRHKYLRIPVDAGMESITINIKFTGAEATGADSDEATGAELGPQMEATSETENSSVINCGTVGGIIDVDEAQDGGGTCSLDILCRSAQDEAALLDILDVNPRTLLLQAKLREARVLAIRADATARGDVDPRTYDPSERTTAQVMNACMESCSLRAARVRAILAENRIMQPACNRGPQRLPGWMKPAQQLDEACPPAPARGPQLAIRAGLLRTWDQALDGRPRRTAPATQPSMVSQLLRNREVSQLLRDRERDAAACETVSQRLRDQRRTAAIRAAASAWNEACRRDDAIIGSGLESSLTTASMIDVALEACSLRAARLLTIQASLEASESSSSSSSSTVLEPAIESAASHFISSHIVSETVSESQPATLSPDFGS